MSAVARILHTADWHLGRLFFHSDLLEDQAKILDQLLDHARARRPHAFIVAGDVFDRANPRREAVDLFDRFLGRLYRETDCAIVVIAGNHDSPERIGYGGALHDPSRVLIRGPLGRSARPLILTVGDRALAVSALPYAAVFAAREHFCSEEITSPQDVLVAQMREARAAVGTELAERGLPVDTPWLVVAHAFVAGGDPTESERPLAAGGIDSVSSTVFAEPIYTALGHLHRRQEPKRGRVAYSGSPLGYGFDEIDIEKSANLVEIDLTDPDSPCSISPLPLVAERALRIVEGTFRDALDAEGDGADDFISFRLTDRLPVPDAMARLRSRYPNAVQLEWIARDRPQTAVSLAAVRSASHDPVSFVASFIETTTGREFDDTMRGVVVTAVDQVIEETTPGDGA